MYITAEQLAKRIGVSKRYVQHMLKEGKPLRGVKSFRKLTPGKLTSSYLIEPDENYFKKKPK